MTRALQLCTLLLAASCGAAPSNTIDQEAQEEASMESGLVAVEFSGSRRSLDRLAAEVAKLGWRIGSRTEGVLRILPPANYDPDRHFGQLLSRIEAMGLSDIGLRLIGPNGPVGPEA